MAQQEEYSNCLQLRTIQAVVSSHVASERIDNAKQEYLNFSSLIEVYIWSLVGLKMVHKRTGRTCDIT